jgi:hypothetical protein
VLELLFLFFIDAQVTAAIKALIFLLPMSGKKRLTAKESFDLMIAYVEVDYF